jgi:hypothetical protein
MVGYHTPRIFLPFAISPVIAFGTPRAKQTNIVPARCAATEGRRQDYPAETFKPNVLYFPIFRVPEYSELSIVSALGAHEFRSVELVGSEYSALPI